MGRLVCTSTNIVEISRHGIALHDYATIYEKIIIVLAILWIYRISKTTFRCCNTTLSLKTAWTLQYAICNGHEFNATTCDFEVLYRTITVDEVECTIRRLKTNKSFAFDNVINTYVVQTVDIF